MDFSNRNSQPQTVAPTAGPASPVNNSGRKNSTNDVKGKWVRLSVSALVAYLVAVVILIAGVLLVLGLDKPKAESGFVDANKLQAVFLNTGQVYFGNVKSLNNTYFVLDNIYYLQTSSNGSSTSSSAANTSVSLVKLGCELHAPYDQMVINRTQVTFWENLQDNGQVAKAVKAFQQQNPSGQKCSDQSSAGKAGSSNVQGTTNTSTGATSTTPTTTTTKP